MKKICVENFPRHEPIDASEHHAYRYTDRSEDKTERFNIKQRQLDCLKAVSAAENENLFLTLNFEHKNKENHENDKDKDKDKDYKPEYQRGKLVGVNHKLSNLSNLSNSRIFKRSTSTNNKIIITDSKSKSKISEQIQNEQKNVN